MYPHTTTLLTTFAALAILVQMAFLARLAAPVIRGRWFAAVKG